MPARAWRFKSSPAHDRKPLHLRGFSRFRPAVVAARTGPRVAAVVAAGGLHWARRAAEVPPNEGRTVRTGNPGTAEALSLAVPQPCHLARPRPYQTTGPMRTPTALKAPKSSPDSPTLRHCRFECLRRCLHSARDRLCRAERPLQLRWVSDFTFAEIDLSRSSGPSAILVSATRSSAPTRSRSPRSPIGFGRGSTRRS